MTVELPPLDKVTGLTAMPGSAHGEIALDWSPVAGANNYEVGQWRRQSGTLFVWEVLVGSEVTIDLNNTSAMVHGLTPGFSYEHSVRVVRVVGSTTVLGPWADGKTAMAFDESPEVPKDLKGVTMVGGRGITLSWQAAVGAQDYEVEASYSGGIATSTAPGLAVNFTGLVPDATYSFRVRSRKPHGSSHLFSEWSSAVSYGAPTPTSTGHQEDHTVEYVIDSISSAPNLPSGVPDPATVIRAAIPLAVAEWNTEAAAISGKNLTICKAGSCGRLNHDGWTTTVKTVDMNNDRGGNHSTNHDEGCGQSVACVKAQVDGSGHLRDMSLIIEEPAWECWAADPSGACTRRARIYWTNVSTDDLQSAPSLSPGSPLSLYHYINPLMLHEFGHTLGLPDFYNDHKTGLMGLPAVMDSHHNNMAITDEDIAQLWAIYAVHDSASH